MVLNRFKTLLENEEHEHREVQLASASEVLGPDSVASQEVGIQQPAAKGFNESDKVVGNIMSNSAHSQANREAARKVQALSRCIAIAYG